jgi:hypothetical protein
MSHIPILSNYRRLRPPGFEMNYQTRPKLFPPLALLAALPTPVRTARLDPPAAHRPQDLRRLVAAMID